VYLKADTCYIKEDMAHGLEVMFSLFCLQGRTMEGFGNSASGGTAYVQPASTSSYSSQQYNSGGGGGHYSSSSSRMVGFGSDGRSFQPQQSGGPGASSFISQDVTTAVSSAVDGISGMIRSTLSSSYKEV